MIKLLEENLPQTTNTNEYYNNILECSNYICHDENNNNKTKLQAIRLILYLMDVGTDQFILKFKEFKKTK